MFIKRLKASQISSLPEGNHADGGNLYLRVKGNGRSWVFRFRKNGRTTELGLGPAPLISLAEARQKALEYRHKLANNELVLPKRRAHHVTPKVITLDKIYEASVKAHIEAVKIRNGRSYLSRAMSRWKATLKKELSGIPLQDITPKMVADCVNTLIGVGSQKNTIQYIRFCYSYAKVAYGYNGPNPVATDGSLKLLIKTRGVPRHFPSANWRDVPQIYANLLANVNPQVRGAFALIILSALRKSEALAIRTEDLHLNEMYFRLPFNKTSKTEVFYPFPKQCIPFLQNPGREFVFETNKGKMHNAKWIDRTFHNLYPEITVHGFRASFSTWCAENGKDSEMRERCLGHAVDNKVAASYQRSDLLDKRRALLQEWADYVTGTPAE